MNVNGAIRSTMGVSQLVLKSYLSDLSDAELMTRPGPQCNHIAWQLGHLIESERSLLEGAVPGAGLTLPEGFAARHTKESSAVTDPSRFLTKNEYLDLLERSNVATLAALDRLNEADLDVPSPEQFRSYAPTVGDLFVMIATHAMMHAGQIVPVRRALGKPVLI